MNIIKEFSAQNVALAIQEIQTINAINVQKKKRISSDLV
jgi:hypothetical protein